MARSVVPPAPAWCRSSAASSKNTAACRASSANSRRTAWAWMVKSWVETGTDMEPISPEDLRKTLGPDLLQQLSEKSGLSVQELTQKLSQILPQAVDKLTPGGSIPKA